MKQFKSINRAIKRGHLRAELDMTTQQIVLKRRNGNKGWVYYPVAYVPSTPTVIESARARILELEDNLNQKLIA